jgi:pimeloyl-ACP methyl ester carboxylesterase
VTQEAAPELLRGRLREADARDRGQSLAQRIARRLKKQGLQELVRGYTSAKDGESRQWLTELKATTTPKELVEALRQPRVPTGTLEPGRHMGFVRAMGRSSRYMMMIPEGYTPEKAWPVHITLHGGGGTPMRNCMQNWKGEAREAGAILVCPSTEGAMWWMPLGEATVLATLEDVRERVHVDLDRVSVGGASSGGYGVWHMATKFPWLFRGAVPRCAATPKDPLTLANLGGLPIFMLHGDRDGRINVFHSRRSQEIMGEMGLDFQYTEVPGVGHRFMGNYNDDVMGWLDEQDRDAWGDFKYRTVLRGDAPARVHWLRPDWGQDYEPGLELEGRLKSRMVQGVWRNEVHLTSTAPLASVTVLLPPEARWQSNQPVQVYLNGNLIHEAPVAPSVEAVLASWEDHRDPSLMTDRAIHLELNRYAAVGAGAGPLGRLAP